MAKINNKGFTIFEIIIVITILSITALTALPKIITFTDEQRVENEAVILVSELRYLQEITRTTQKWHSEFRSAPYELTPSMKFRTNDYYIEKDGQHTHEHTFPSDMKWHINRNNNTVEFAANGDAPPCTISMQIGTAHRNVIIDSAGRVRIE